MSAPTAGSLFTGYGGLDHALTDAIGPTRLAWVCDNDKAASRLLAHHHPDVPNLGDITAVDWTRVEPVDILTGGFPCQDVSHAGRRAGLAPGTRTGLWARMADAIDHLRPALVVAENVRGLLSARAASDVEPCPWCVGGAGDGEPALRALGAVLGDLADLGYDAAWHGLRAADVGAPHGRFRVFVVAWPADSDAAELGRRASRRYDGLWAAGLEPHPAGHPDCLGREWSGRARDGWLRPESSGRSPAAADSYGSGWQRPQPAPGRLMPDGGPAADPESHGWDEGWPESAGIVGGSDAPVCGAAPADTDGDGLALVVRSEPGMGPREDADGRGPGSWGPYAGAVARWERALDRPAPAPTEPSRTGGRRLNPRFVEWMMGCPDGWVCDVPGLTRNDKLKLLGNGVVRQQGSAAIGHLLQLIDQMRAVA